MYITIRKKNALIKLFITRLQFSLPQNFTHVTDPLPIISKNSQRKNFFYYFFQIKLTTDVI